MKHYPHSAHWRTTTTSPKSSESEKSERGNRRTRQQNAMPGNAKKATQDQLTQKVLNKILKFADEATQKEHPPDFNASIGNAIQH